MAASRQNEELKKKKKKKRAINVPVTIGHSCTLQMQKSMADSPREHNLSTGGASNKSTSTLPPASLEKQKKKKKTFTLLASWQ